jgi:hypothetical protein
MTRANRSQHFGISRPSWKSASQRLFRLAWLNKVCMYACMYKRACELNKSCIISIDEDPGLRIESFAVINLRGVSTNKKYYTFYIYYTKLTLPQSRELWEFADAIFCFFLLVRNFSPALITSEASFLQEGQYLKEWSVVTIGGCL